MKQAMTEDWELILVEGVFALWDEQLTPFLDLKLYVYCDSDERLVRRIKRHLKIGQDLTEITERYVQAVQPRHMEYAEPTKWKYLTVKYQSDINSYSSTKICISDQNLAPE